jgi:2-polyprenyl-3-methyl-5-hydroxy-6-metoxy-1,4-benzoquinol methylase
MQGLKAKEQHMNEDLGMRFECPLCRGKHYHILQSTFSHSPAITEKFAYARCLTCDFVSLFPQPDTKSLGEYYLQGRGTNAYDVGLADSAITSRSALGNLFRSQWTKLIQPSQFLIEKIITHGRVLDLGCSVGNLLLSFSKRGLEAEGVDFDAAAIAYCRSRGLNARIADLTDFELEPFRYDFIVLQHTLEHILDPACFLKRIRQGLAETGKIVVEVPNVNCFTRYVFGPDWHGWDPPFHVNQFDERSLQRALRMAGYEVIQSTVLASVEELRCSMMTWKREAKARHDLARISALPIYKLIEILGYGGVLLITACRG